MNGDLEVQVLREADRSNLLMERAVLREELILSGSECHGLPHQPYLTEPPACGPHVQWCGRGVARITRYPLFRFLLEFAADRERSAFLRGLHGNVLAIGRGCNDISVAILGRCIALQLKYSIGNLDAADVHHRVQCRRQ